MNSPWLKSKEGDLIVGSHNRSVIGTLVERQTRYVKLLHLPSRDSQTLYATLVAGMGHLPAGLRKTLTWDQGTEMASHLDVTRDTGMKVYFWLYAFAWGAWVLMRGGLGWVGQLTPPVWSSTRSL